jgi:hypothetical protein
MSIKSTAHRSEVGRKQLERVCRMYLTDIAAARALGIGVRKYQRLCHKHSILTPHERKKGCK